VVRTTAAVLKAVSECERRLQHSVTASLLHVIAGDGDGVELGHVLSITLNSLRESLSPHHKSMNIQTQSFLANSDDFCRDLVQTNCCNNTRLKTAGFTQAIKDQRSLKNMRNRHQVETKCEKPTEHKVVIGHRSINNKRPHGIYG